MESALKSRASLKQRVLHVLCGIKMAAEISLLMQVVLFDPILPVGHLNSELSEHERT